jgi:hypothetical protein
MNWDIFIPNFLCASRADRSSVSVPRLDISHYVTEELVPVPTLWNNAPHSQDTLTPVRNGLLEKVSRTIFGSTGPRQQEERSVSSVTERQRAVDPDTVPAFSSEQQQLLQPQTYPAAADQRRLRLKTELAELDTRIAAASSLEASPKTSDSKADNVIPVPYAGTRRTAANRQTTTRQPAQGSPRHPRALRWSET